MIHRLNELTSKYEIYVQSMNKEKIETTNENSGHVKLLASKLLGILMQKWLNKNYKESFSDLYLNCYHSDKLERGILWLNSALNWLEARKKLQALWTWYQALSPGEEYKKIVNLVKQKA